MTDDWTDVMMVAVPVDSAVLQPPVTAAPAATDDVGAFMGTMAVLLRESVAHFEKTADRVSELVMAQKGRAGADLMMAMQDFDRLQQEFSALGNVLEQLETVIAGPWPGDATADELKARLLSCVTIADVKRRLAVHFEPPIPEVNLAGLTEEELTAEF